MNDQTISRLGQQVQVTRETVSETVVKGKLVPSAVTVFHIQAVVTPASQDNMQLLPEGELTTDAISIYTTTSLQETVGITGTTADKVSWSGRTYRVVLIRPWGQFFECLAIRVGR